MEHEFFDCNTVIGRYYAPPPGPEDYTSPAALTAAMDYFEISDALVYHQTALRGVTRPGNEMLLEEIADYPNLHPCWVVSPYHLAERDKPKNLVKELIKLNIKAVRLCPGSGPYNDNSYLVNDWMCGELLSSLAELEIPVFINNPSLNDIHFLGMEFPCLPVVIYCPITHFLFPFLEKFENLYVETAHLVSHNVLEYICEKFGAERILFSTAFGLPRFTSPAAAIINLTTAAVSDAEKSQIASGNLKRLLKMPLKQKKKPQINHDDPFIDSLRKGLPLKNEVIIDAHAHVIPDASMAVDAAPPGMVRVMDRLGIDQACVSGADAIDVLHFNAMTANAVKQFPQRFIGYARVDPNYPLEIEKELEFRFFHCGMKHIKLHPVRSNYPINGAAFAPAFEFAMKHRSVVLVHSQQNTDTCPLALFDEVAERYPELIIIMGHAGNVAGSYREAIEMMKKHRNLYIDTSGWCMQGFGVLEYVVSQIGADRILFGSDFPAAGLSATFAIGAVAYAGISLENKRKIMGLNAKKLFQK